MRRAARVDANHGAVVSALEAIGCMVLSLASLGRGVADLLVCTPGSRLLLLEVKDGRRRPSARRLTAAQEGWHERWRRAPLYVTSSPEDAVRLARLVDG